MVNVITYRGPGMAGGLSSSLGQAWNEYVTEGDVWWHIGDNNFQVLKAGSDKTQPLVDIPADLLKGHYRYCNEFLWPVMHDLGQYAIYRAEDQRRYARFNQFIAQAIIRSSERVRIKQSGYFIHDYHFALLPSLLKRASTAKSALFWHIPWPKTLSHQSFILPLIDLARNLLSVNVLGFHTQEYADNFMTFVETYLPEFICHWSDMSIFKSNNGPVFQRQTELIVAPVGIDSEYWQTNAKNTASIGQPFLNRPYILSVDRADYTKGVINRFKAIDHFFERFPQWREKITFVQSCGRTRRGLAVFDKYWDECLQLKARVEDKWATEDWCPLLWIESSQDGNKLAQFYRNAAVMLVNPIRDGLNLTAKEYVACQGPNPGVLALSEGAGAWHELGKYSLRVNPKQPEQMAEMLYRALSLSEGERSLRMNLLADVVQQNSLAKWWYCFKNRVDSKREVRTLKSISVPSNKIFPLVGLNTPKSAPVSALY